MYQTDVDGLSDILIEIGNMKSITVLFNVQGNALPIKVNANENESNSSLIGKARKIVMCDIIQQQGNPRLEEES